MLEASDYKDVKLDALKLNSILRSKGYMTNANLLLPQEAYENKRILEDYLVGQVMNMLSSGGTVHPMLADKIRELTV